MSALLGVVLAGGASRRLGRDKALLRIGGHTLVERAAGALAAVTGEVAVVTAPDSEASAPCAATLHDLRPGEGPLAGIEAAFAHARGRGLFVLACDLPRVGPEAIAHLLAAAEPAARRPAVWLAALGAERQPLCGVWSAGCREPVTAALAAGRRGVLDLLETVEVTPVELDDRLPFYRPDLLLNVNRAGDLARIAPEAGAASRAPA